MDISEAREIVEALANGVNPVTGEILSKESCFNEPDIIRALFLATEELKKSEKRGNRKLPDNAGKPWSNDLDNELKEMFISGKSKKEICEHFGRTAGAITTRLVRLGLIQSQDEFRYK
ncbi:MAG: hypothetical protein KBS52_06840 [Clostridiales bacterium]|nr:hypothetical protein [Candidatus Equinaster intestinalis]